MIELEIRNIIESYNRRKISFFSILFFIFLSVFLLSKIVPDKYTSSSLLAYQNNLDSTQINSLSQFSGLASMAGIDLGDESANRKQEVLAIMTSKDFLASFIDKYDLMPYIIAGNGWDMNTNSISYDNSIYRINDGSWVRKKKKYRNVVPSLFEGQEEFLKNNLRI